MKNLEAAYRLIDCKFHEWRFQESAEMTNATEEFNSILERVSGPFGGWSSMLANALREFLKRYPNHIDALHHYASCMADDANYLEALVFSQTAVAVGLRILPKGFKIGRDRLPTGFVQNRPFLRALQGLMLAQRSLDLVEEAIESGQMCLALDPEDRNGARESLVYYLLEVKRNSVALELFEDSNYKDTFGPVEYLHSLVNIRLCQKEKSYKILKKCLDSYPQVARFILNTNLPQPDNESNFGGVISGSELEGWLHAKNFGSLWRTNKGAMAILREASLPLEKLNWPRWQNRESTN